MNFTREICIILSCLFGISCCNNLISLTYSWQKFLSFSGKKLLVRLFPGHFFWNIPALPLSRYIPSRYSCIDQSLAIFMGIAMMEMTWGIHPHRWENLQIICYFGISCWYAYRIGQQRRHLRTTPASAQRAESYSLRPKSDISLLICCEMMLSMSWMIFCMKFFPMHHPHNNNRIHHHMANITRPDLWGIIPEVNIFSRLPWWGMLITLILGFTAIISALHILYLAPYPLRKHSAEKPMLTDATARSQYTIVRFIQALCESGAQFGLAYMLLSMLS